MRNGDRHARRTLAVGIAGAVSSWSASGVAFSLTGAVIVGSASSGRVGALAVLSRSLRFARGLIGFVDSFFVMRVRFSVEIVD